MRYGLYVICLAVIVIAAPSFAEETTQTAPTVASAGPDLVATFGCEEGKPPALNFKNGNLKICVLVKNQGTALSKDAEIQVFHGDKMIKKSSVKSIKPGEFGKKDLSLTRLAPGKGVLQLKIDSKNQNPETNEENNLVKLDITVPQWAEELRGTTIDMREPRRN